MRLLIYLYSITVIISSCSTLKKVQTNTANKLVQEKYYVKKSNKDIKEGKYLQFFINTKISEGAYSNNSKSGEWHYYDLNGKLNFSGSYESNQKHGKWTYYYNNKLSSEIFYNNGETDSINGYHKNGQLTYEVRYNPDKTGYCKSFYSNGKIKELIHLKNKVIHGVYTFYFENGQLHHETEYNEGKKISILRTFDLNGNAINGGTLNQGNGTYITFHISEKMDSSKLNTFVIKNYKNGLLNGDCKYFQKNGNVITEGIFEEGYRVGEWKIFNEDGSFETTVNYDSDFYKRIRKREPDVFYIGNEVEKITIMPEFQGGESQREDFLIKNIRYPQEARLKNIEGTVYINFIISQTGELESFKIIKGVNELLDNEVIRMTQTMPRWSPGLEHGIPVRVSFNMPVKFRLK
jgi:TonB family protein